MSDRTILHADCNSFFSSVSLLYNPHLQHLPVAVGGDPESRHGIILAKNEHAKKYFIKTGMPLWQARSLCPELVILPPEYHKYKKYSDAVKAIFSEYTDMQEAFGSDESWLDVTGSASLFGDGETIAHTLRKRIKHELGITVSVGVSWNKVFAKLGSDMKKPDAVTVISKKNYKEKVFPLPVGELLCVGPATERKLKNFQVLTIGDLAHQKEKDLREWFGVVGSGLWAYANGYENSSVGQTEPPVKSVGNSSVTNRDLTTNEEVKRLIYTLAESVGPRMREHGFAANTIEVWVCDNSMGYVTRQRPMSTPSNLNRDLATAAYQLFVDTWKWNKPVRKVGIKGKNLVFDTSPCQLSFDLDWNRQDKLEKLDSAVDGLNKRWPYCVKRAITTVETGAMENILTKENQRMFSPVSWY